MPTIISVQGLRAIAALAVVAIHFITLYFWLQGLRPKQATLPGLAAGVDLFFVISGFVMVYASEDLFAAKGGARRFLARRIARIVPPYWIMMSIAIPATFLPTDWGSLIGSYLFFPYRAADENIVPVYGVGWTLNFEMYFYVLFSAVIVLRKNVAVPVLCALLVGIVLLGQLLRPVSASLIFWSDPIILEFVFGMVLAMLFGRGVALPTYLRVLLVIAGAASVFLFEPRMPPSGYRCLQWGVPAAMIVAGTILGKEVNFGGLRALIKLLGDSSYTLYLSHSLMVAAVLSGWQLGLNRYPMIAVLVLAVIAIQLISIVVFYFEKRLSKSVHRIMFAPVA